MGNLSGMGIRTLLLLVLATVLLALDVNTAYAQSSACSRLERQLRQFDRNGDFQQRDGNSQAARQLARDVQNAESRYIRDGCNDAAKAGQTLSPQCQQVAREVLRLRRDYAAVSQSVNSAGAVAQQREAILQEMARFGCSANGGSNATFSSERQNVFDRIFGTTTEGDFSNGQVINGGSFGYQGYRTVRTVCVRLSDGYFWPISYSTLPDYVGNDMGQCKAMCPNEPVEIYYYDNPGQEPEQMRNMFNQAYTDLPTAFKYRNAIDMNASCKVAPRSDGTLTMATTADGQSRAMVDVQGESFPLPLRDPRGQVPVQAAAAVQVASLVDVPLPRPRPAGPGETVTRVVAPPPGDSQLRLVQFGEKVVRVVGPDTPYAQPTGAGS